VWAASKSQDGPALPFQDRHCSTWRFRSPQQQPFLTQQALHLTSKKPSKHSTRPPQPPPNHHHHHLTSHQPKMSLDVSSSVAKRYASPASLPASTTNAHTRLQTELMQLMMSATPGISAFPQEGNLTRWTGTINGPEGTPYEGLTFKLSLEFPSNYPMSPPLVLFTTPMFHPNVDMAGRICLDILKVRPLPFLYLTGC
jgi:hypothetical protein